MTNDPICYENCLLSVRQASGLTLEEFSKITKVSANRIRNIELKNEAIPAAFLPKFCNALCLVESAFFPINNNLNIKRNYNYSCIRAEIIENLTYSKLVGYPTLKLLEKTLSEIQFISANIYNSTIL